MRTAITERVSIAFCTMILVGSTSGHAQTVSPAAPTAASPTASQNSPAKLTQPEERKWSAVGATAQCRDGTYLHGKLDQHACADHGGVRKWLEASGQDLIR
jgi:hypothetical protein